MLPALSNIIPNDSFNPELANRPRSVPSGANFSIVSLSCLTLEVAGQVKSESNRAVKAVVGEH
jgi:hypothetical protein